MSEGRRRAQVGGALVAVGLVVLALAFVIYRSADSPPTVTPGRCLSPGSGPSTITNSSTIAGPGTTTTVGPTASAGPAISAAGSRGVPPPPPVGSRTRFAPGRTPLCGFGEVRVVITDGAGHRRVHCLLAAVTDAQRERGLMEVTDGTLGGYDGMLFRFGTDQTGGFYMRDTPMPLSIAYFDAAGRLVSQTDMKPCADRADCPTYPGERPFRAAVEVPTGRLAALGIDAQATLSTGRANEACPAA